MPTNSTATGKDLYKWLLRLSLKVRQPEHVSARLEDTLRIYATDLTDFPPDLVERVLNDWPNKSSYWPTWKELRDSLKAARPLKDGATEIEKLLAIGSDR